ncbi:glycosyltransferase [Aphanothece sacrum]|uniref:UDP-glucose-beta-D-glucan glucosyltransferase n=1 Tax=Aphanothece sacrum FPU1 TaxID=1920663 RepID=A0A401ILX4_APHSA|nr:glycosyltransferase [Aphanothece sacrum]GBF82245.1 UDP-glucose-beta-D-glucan glucosyltransferase [Aphanothece sacrum FPU1]GBF87217.1 UDP-glucose-beta-D-glucan glucosyltransferase [Aphanothece sacrum FPU3]
MDSSNSIYKKIKKALTNGSILPKYKATWILLGIVGFFSAIALAWLLGEKNIVELFNQLNIWQEQPLLGIEVPINNPFSLYFPTLIFFIITQVVMKLSPQPKYWSRGVIILILLGLIIRYFLWRTLSTLNLSNPVDGIFSLGLFLLELVVIISSIIQLVLRLNIKERRREADLYSQAVIEGSYHPSVDIFIPTYNEHYFILKRTVIGCQALNYANKEIYILDDTRRTEIKQLAEELGCYYINRPDNLDAKAGNINHAIAQTQGDLIAVFDADFIPTNNFLERTVGFFQKKKIALIQTPQSFYNSDPITRNLGLDNIVNAEEEVFYRQTELVNDAAGCVVCCGTSFVVRRSLLEEVGGFVTESISEDYLTGIRLSARGYEVIYLNEKLSAGLAAESISSYIAQRLRWGRGTLQALFIKENPFTIAGLNFRQRLANFQGIIFWLNVIHRSIFLVIPFLYYSCGIIFFKASSSEIIYLFLPLCITQISVSRWLSSYAHSWFFSEIYSLVSCVPVAINSLKVMLNPFETKFTVTPKGISRERYIYHWKLAFPLIFLFVINLISLFFNLKEALTEITGINLGLYWSTYNLIIIGVALCAFLDKPQPQLSESFPIKKKVKLINSTQTLEGETIEISEQTAIVKLPNNVSLDGVILLDIDRLRLKSQIIEQKIVNHEIEIKVQFLNLNLSQERQLINLLYCQPGRWKFKELQKNPGELYSLWLMLKIVLRRKMVV